MLTNEPYCKVLPKYPYIPIVEDKLPLKKTPIATHCSKTPIAFNKVLFLMLQYSDNIQ